MIWPNGVIRNEWLQTTVLNVNIPLPDNDVFYWGNAVAEAGDYVGDPAGDPLPNAKVTTVDLLLARNNPRGFPYFADIDFLYDYNRDKHVDVYDVLLARNNQTSFFDDLKLISPPSSAAMEEAPPAALAEEASQEEVQADGLAWVYEMEKLRAGDRSSDKDDDAKRAIDFLLTFWP